MLRILSLLLYLANSSIKKTSLTDFQDSPDDEEDTRSNEEEVSSDDNEMVEMNVLMALTNDENGVVGKESARNGEWVKISMRKCICEKIPNQKKRILGVDQLTKDPSCFGQTDLVFVKSSTVDTHVSIPNVKRPWLYEAEKFNMSNHDTSRILPSESQVKVTDPFVNVTNSLVTEYDSAEKIFFSSTPLPLLEKLSGVEPVSVVMVFIGFAYET
ncbi:hypothetical protein Tco_0308557 [Tanacetum coccineum]